MSVESRTDAFRILVPHWNARLAGPRSSRVGPHCSTRSICARYDPHMCGGNCGYLATWAGFLGSSNRLRGRNTHEHLPGSEYHGAKQIALVESRCRGCRVLHICKICLLRIRASGAGIVGLCGGVGVLSEAGRKGHEGAGSRRCASRYRSPHCSAGRFWACHVRSSIGRYRIDCGSPPTVCGHDSGRGRAAARMGSDSWVGFPHAHPCGHVGRQTQRFRASAGVPVQPVAWGDRRDSHCTHPRRMALQFRVAWDRAHDGGRRLCDPACRSVAAQEHPASTSHRTRCLDAMRSGYHERGGRGLPLGRGTNLYGTRRNSYHHSHRPRADMGFSVSPPQALGAWAGRGSERTYAAFAFALPGPDGGKG